jgi:fructose-bisphosphate aldolase class 1
MKKLTIKETMVLEKRIALLITHRKVTESELRGLRKAYEAMVSVTTLVSLRGGYRDVTGGTPNK